jgi:hypothetical protein
MISKYEKIKFREGLGGWASSIMKGTLPAPALPMSAKTAF